MAWWGWLLLAWVVVAVLLALGMGAAARTIDREERAAAARERARRTAEPPLDEPDAPPAAPWRTWLSAGLRGGPRR